MGEPQRSSAESSHRGSPFSGGRNSGGARVLDLRSKRGSACPDPEQNVDQPAQTGAAAPDQNSGTRITLSNIFGRVADTPGDWASITTVWTDAPDSLATSVRAVLDARDADNPAAYCLAVWALLVLPARTMLHLLSWALSHPYRTVAVLVAAAITYLAA